MMEHLVSLIYIINIEKTTKRQINTKLFQDVLYMEFGLEIFVIMVVAYFVQSHVCGFPATI